MNIRNWSLAFACFAVFVWLNNTSLFTDGGSPKFLAHRGLAQTFDVAAVEWNTNTAAMIHPPEHPYLENTLESLRAAFAHGADVVEFDIQLTRDGKLAVFHDFTLEFRTGVPGKIADYGMEELKRLDIGHGYTADNGKTWPFRGEGMGLMPEIGEVFAAFPGRDLLIHIKDDRSETAEALWALLEPMPRHGRDRITVYGGDIPIRYLRGRDPNLRLLSLEMMKKGLLLYALVGWTGYVPEALGNMELHLPLRYARWLWGWPGKFTARMEKVNTRVVVVNGSGKFSEGFDSPEDMRTLPPGFTGYIWTNRIDRVAGQ